MDSTVRDVWHRLPAEARKLADAVPERGSRRDTMLDIANMAGKAGLTNHEIIVVLEYLADEWGVLPPTNLYKRYESFLGMVVNVRRHLAEDALKLEMERQDV